MTTPGGDAPDGAYVIGSRFGSDETEAGIRAKLRGGTLNGYEDSQMQWQGLTSDLAELADEIRDGQLDLIDRIDLLEGVEGYCSTFLGKNWNVAPGQRIKLPFDVQLGPNKGAVPYNDGIRLLSKGLWRSDCHVSFYKSPGAAIAASVHVMVCRVSDDTVYSEHEYDIVVTASGAETAAFSHTFVISSNDNFYVRVEVKHNRNARHGVYGGTLRSALSVNKWDNGTSNNVVLPVAPEGGNLG